MRLKPIFFRGIGRKILIWLTFFSLVPLLVSSVRSYQHNRTAITTDVLEHLSSVVSLKKLAVLKFLEYNRFAIESIAAGNNYLFDNVQRAEFFPKDSKEYLDSFRKLTAHLIRKQRDNKNIDELFIVDPQRRVLCSSDPAYMDYDYRDSRVFQGTPPQETQIRQFYSNRLERPTLVVMCSIINNDEQILGTLVLRVNLQRLYDIINDRTGMRNTGQTYLVDKNGLLLSEVDTDGLAVMRETRLSAGIKACLQGKNDKGIYVNYQGREVVGACRWIPEMQWGLISEIETNEAFQPIIEMRNRTVLLGLFILVAAVLAAFIITHDIVGPIKTLAGAAKRMAGGAFGEKLSIKTNDEFEEIAEEFNTMAASLGRYKEMLENWNLKLAEEVKKRTQDLKSSEERYLNLIESSVDAIVVTDLHGKVTFFSKGAENISGYAAGHMLGCRIYEYYAGGREAAGKIMQGIRAQGRIQNYELEFKSRDKGILKLNLSASFLKDRDGRYTGVLGVGRDVTGMRALEKQLMQAERLATIGRMSSQVAHEIRNPLSSISLNAELLEDEIMERSTLQAEEIETILKAIHAEIKRLFEITEDYLQFARLPKPDFDAADINDIFKSLMDFYKEELNSKRLKLKKNLYPDKLIALVDENQLRRALLNLLRNATEASRPGGEIVAETLSKDGNIEIVIGDTGRGVPEDKLDKIFEPFYSTKEMGTGLGLPLTQQIVSEHNGTIRCESEAGKGTRFIISLPRYSGRRR